MESRDLEAVLRLINIEGWNYDISELQRILKVSPGTSIVSTFDDKVIGGITATLSGNRCVLGHVVIDSAWRRKGLGKIMINHLIREMDSRGVEILDVYSVKNAMDFYAQHGFKYLENLDTFTTMLTEGMKKGASDDDIRDLTGSDLGEMSRLDLIVTGFDRRNILSVLLEEFPGCSKGFFENDKLIAFILCRTNPIMSDIGPWTMSVSDEGIGSRLLGAVLAELPAGKLTILGVPASNKLAHNICTNAGFKTELYNYRMVKSKKAVDRFTEGTFALSAFEFG
ncbi:MAG: GNAT family N-acetyltransferase [Thermoplasmata archaeon]|nr:GNAT family N-acetyltransferase [Thermoplasmata archaeon]